MSSRRRFLGMAGIAAAGASAGLVSWPARGAEFSQEVLRKKAELKQHKDRLLGYPINMNDPPPEFFAWRDELLQLGVGAFAFNNVGNPFKPSPIPFNTHELERETILRFGKLYGFPPTDIWGFISNSGTDSNMHGMYMGRKLLKGRTGKTPICYFTREAHYSVEILRDLLNLDTVFVETTAEGGMDPRDLEIQLKKNANSPALVVATIGTTFIGAVDRVEELQQVLQGTESYLHVDAALFGGYLPYTSFASQIANQATADSPSRYDSLAVSCHKFFGFPAPAGIFLTRQSIYEEFNELFRKIHNPDYIHQVPGTITCSRDSVKPAEFHFFSRPESVLRQRQDAAQMLENADYLLQQLKSRFPSLVARRSNPMSNTVMFRNPGPRIIEKYSLATMHRDTDGVSENYAHVVVMPHVTRTVLDAFLGDLELATRTS